MKIFQYENYDHYKRVQVEANRKKLHWVWCSRSTLEKIRENHPDANTILCHGARNGTEVKWFRELYPDAEVIGTDISPTANNFFNMVEWDFHERNEEWVGKFDIVYSNSFDHSYDPHKSLNTWFEQLSLTGVLCLELPVGINNRSCETDPLQIRQSEVLEIANNNGFNGEIVHFIYGSIGRSRLLILKRND